jgi:hypothetical protein
MNNPVLILYAAPINVFFFYERTNDAEAARTGEGVMELAPPRTIT